MSNLQEIDPKQIKWDDLGSMYLTSKAQTKIRNYLLNQSPIPAWIQKHPLYQNDYLPIDKVEYLLTVFFGKWRAEIKNVFQIANSVCVTVRLYYFDIDKDDYDWQDGGGASPLQVNSGAKPMDSDQIKSNAVMLALPIAETNAIKDAADKIGKIFGRDLNRKNTLDYDVLIKNPDIFKDAKITEK